ncbi:hypothetical protein [Curtobacterium sp. APC 4022]|uniref:hypothetical protein n=1 Tax=Curtobacterium sp. APC 4022 TaxID=3035201 RepID=UPI0025B529D1|nr:hypothetical protein [Curtobacterium sp. APC 4022]MDN3478883.1 hypothetical protein [Curtobacterium sp. APC 4022]
MIRLGWQVFRARFGEDVSPKRFRRAVTGGVVVGPLAALVLGLTVVNTGWTGTGPVRATIVVVLTSLAAGLVTVGCFPLAQTHEPPATIDGERVRPETTRLARASVQRYLVPQPPEMRPEDRADVLHDTALVRRTLVVDVARAAAVLIGCSLAGIALLTTSDRATVGFTMTLLVVWTLPSTFLQLGRTERAHRAAAALPPSETAATPPTARNRFPSGSKIGLPGG